MQLEEFNPVLDPRIKPSLRAALLERIYAPMQFRLAKMLTEIITTNCTKICSAYRWFVHQGILYSDLALTDPATQAAMRQIRQLLDPTLHDNMALYLQEAKEVEAETPFVTGCINAVLNVSNSPKDWLRLLPDNLHGPLLFAAQTYDHIPAKLTDAKVDEFLTRHAKSIDLMRCRLVLNMIL